jgi:hypothetical protein
MSDAAGARTDLQIILDGIAAIDHRLDALERHIGDLTTGQETMFRGFELIMMALRQEVEGRVVHTPHSDTQEMGSGYRGTEYTHSPHPVSAGSFGASPMNTPTMTSHGFRSDDVRSSQRSTPDLFNQATSAAHMAALQAQVTALRARAQAQVQPNSPGAGAAGPGPGYIPGGGRFGTESRTRSKSPGQGWKNGSQQWMSRGGNWC